MEKYPGPGGKQVKDSEMRVLAVFTTQQRSRSTGPGARAASGRTCLSSRGLADNVDSFSQRPVAPKLVHSRCTYSECSEAEVSKPFKEPENRYVCFAGHTRSAVQKQPRRCTTGRAPGIWILWNSLMSQHTVLLSFFSRLKTEKLFLALRTVHKGGGS